MEHARSSGPFERTEGVSGSDRWEQRYRKLENNPGAQNPAFRVLDQGVSQYQNPIDIASQTDQQSQSRLKERNNLAACSFGGDPVVGRVQASLIQAGYNLGNYGYKGVDGVNGPLTTKAIAEFQKSVNLEPTGKADFETLKMLDRVTEKGLKKADIEALGNKTVREPDSHRQEPQPVKLIDELSPEAQKRLAERDVLAGQAKNGNPYVAKSQASLQMAGYELGKGGIDGINGPDTSKAVMAYQKDRRLNPTGKLDTETMISLNNATAEDWKRPRPEQTVEKPEIPPSHAEHKSVSDHKPEKNSPHYTVSYDTNATLNRAGSLPIPKNSVFYDRAKASQNQLHTMGFDIGPEGADGKIGKHTTQAIKDFQTAVHLPVTGELDKTTANRIENEFMRGMVAQRNDSFRDLERKEMAKNTDKKIVNFEYENKWTIGDKEFIDENALSQKQITNICYKNNPELVNRGYDIRVYEIAHKIGINPKVVLATLAQEQSWGKNGNYDKLFGVGPGGNPNTYSQNEYGGLETSVKTYLKLFKEGQRNLRPLRVNYDPKHNELSAVVSKRYDTLEIRNQKVSQWIEKHPEEAKEMQQGEMIQPNNAAMYAKLRYTPWTNFPPQNSHPLWDWQKLFRSF